MRRKTRTQKKSVNNSRRSHLKAIILLSRIVKTKNL